MTEASPSPPTRRVVDTLRALARGPLTHGELARRVGMTAATTHAVLGELVACDWVQRDEASRLYRLGPGLLAWAAPLVRPDARISQAVAALAGAFTAGLEEVVHAGYSMEAYGPHIVQLLTVLQTSAPDLGRERADRLTEDLQQMIVRGDHDLAAKYPALVSVPVRTASPWPGSLTVQLGRTDDEPASVVPVLRTAAAALERELAAA